MSQFVPDTTAIKRSRVRNMDDDRLQRRAARLKIVLKGGGGFDRRADWMMRVIELATIEDELDRRGVPQDRTTMDAATRAAISSPPAEAIPSAK